MKRLVKSLCLLFLTLILSSCNKENTTVEETQLLRIKGVLVAKNEDGTKDYENTFEFDIKGRYTQKVNFPIINTDGTIKETYIGIEYGNYSIDKEYTILIQPDESEFYLNSIGRCVLNDDEELTCDRYSNSFYKE